MGQLSKGILESEMTDAVASQPRWVVAHCGARDQYQLPISFHEVGQLHRFVTDWYSPLDSPIAGTLLKHAPLRHRSILARRYHSQLPSRLVKDFKVDGALNRAFRTDERELELDRLVGENAARLTSDSESHLLITSYNGWAAFPKLSKFTKKVLFQIHPHPWFLRELYSTPERKFDLGDSFKVESEMRVSDEFLRRWGRESLDADIVIAASSFTRRSLVHVGVKPERIRIVPYGVDSQVFRNDVACPSGKPKVLFVGQPTSRKGLWHLLEVWEQLVNQEAELHVATGSTANKRDLRSGGSVFWYERLDLSQLVELINRSDLLVLPAIAEGFAHVLLEALSCGTPILSSDASAAPDLLKGWDEQFLFAAGDWDALASKLDHWLTNVDRLRRLRGSARDLAERFTRERFRNDLRNACNEDVGPQNPT